MIAISYASVMAGITALWVLVRGFVCRRQRKILWKREAQLLLVYICMMVVTRFTFFPFSKVNGQVQPLLFDASKIFPPRINLLPIVYLFDYPIFREALINFIGLLLIARLGFNAAIGIAFLTGILNIIPYVGPLLGGALGTVLGLVIKYSSAVPVGLDVNFWIFTVILIAIFCFTQLIDNMLYQPVIYSTSIKAKPLEIFIVLLIVGHIGGPLGMIVAIPCYTVVRVVAFRFFRHIKAIRRLIPSERLITDENNDE